MENSGCIDKRNQNKATANTLPVVNFMAPEQNKSLPSE